MNYLLVNTLKLLEEVKKKIIIFLIIGIAVGFTVGGAINLFILDDEKLFFPFEEVKFDENDYFEFHSAYLYSRDEIITTNERLLLKLELTNKQPYNLTIEPEIYTWTGNNEPKIQNLHNMTYGIKYGPAVKSYFFTAPSMEGENFLKILIKISYSNGTHIDDVDYITTQNILSTESAIQENQSTTLMWSVIISGLVGSGTVGALLWTIRVSMKENSFHKTHTKEIEDQTKILKNQAKMENRPWIGASKGIQFVPEFSRHTFYLKNYGKTPAFKVREHGDYSETKPSKDKVREMEVSDSEAMVLPQQEAQFHFQIPKSKIEQSIKGEITLYFSIFIKYQTQNKENAYGVIYRYSPEQKYFAVEEEWTDYE